VIPAPPVNFAALAPMLVLFGTAVLVLVLDLLPPRRDKTHLAIVSLAGAIGAMLVAVTRWGRDQRGFRDMVVLDNYALFVDVILCYAVALVILLSIDYLRREGVQTGEYYALVLLSASGMMLMASANDLVVVFLSLELMSLCLYVLAGLFKQRLDSGEASMKYFLLGAFASSFLLYGIALTYGATGSTSFERIATAAAGPARGDVMFLVGIALMLVGFGFKISAAPFHMWAPDVYQGAPTSVTALIATGSKAAAFAALIRLLIGPLRPVQPEWTALMWGLAAVTMTLGNVVAIAQSNLKRMLAYSSIAHVGYMLVGLVAGGAAGAGAILYYLFAYTFTTIGTFGVLSLCARAGEEAVEVEDYAGLGRRHPLLAGTLTVFLLSLIGIPPLAGFVGKFYVFGAAVQSGYLWLAIIAVLNSAVAAYYYLRVVVYMYMREPEAAGATLAPSFAGGVALAVAAAGIVILGVLPAPFAELAQSAVATLVR
jgi:NADH-quinone oxidoreductase subunit N